MEPIQCEAGILIPPAGYLEQTRALCTKFRVLFLADEIQTGLGRTGRRFACDHEDVVPGRVHPGQSTVRGLLPGSAFVTSRNVMNVFTPGSHGSTYGGNPLACAVARTALAYWKKKA